jgi:hypothetical protein
MRATDVRTRVRDNSNQWRRQFQAKLDELDLGAFFERRRWRQARWEQTRRGHWRFPQGGWYRN